jgi:hypothetical protein
MLLRYASGDRGARPSNGVFWESPDIYVVANQPAEFAPLAPPLPAAVAQANVPNTLYAHVWNLGKAPAYGVRVEFWWFDPSGLRSATAPCADPARHPARHAGELRAGPEPADGRTTTADRAGGSPRSATPELELAADDAGTAERVRARQEAVWQTRIEARAGLRRAEEDDGVAAHHLSVQLLACPQHLGLAPAAVPGVCVERQPQRVAAVGEHGTRL